MAVPKITEAKIKGWLGAAYVERGLNYYRQGHVLSYQWSGEKLTGRVQGSEPRPYRVTLLFDGPFLEGGCSCPMGGGCKHVAAVLYAAMNDKSAPAGAGSKARQKKTPALSVQLEQLDKPDLINLLTALLEEDPSLADVLKTQLLIVGAATLPPDQLRERVRQLVDRIRPGLDYSDEGPYGYAYAHDDDEYDDAAWDDLAALVEQAKKLVAEGRCAAAHNLVSALLGELLLISGESAGDDELLDLVKEATKQLIACWRALPPEDKLRAAALRQLFEVLAWAVRFGGGQGQTLIEKALLESALPAERETLREWMALASRQSQASRRDFSDDRVETTWARLDQKLAALEGATTKKTKRR